jgi:hypothetical protein
MSNAVSLREIINEMAELGERHVAFLNRRTGELLTLNEQQRLIMENGPGQSAAPDWHRELVEGLRSGDIVELPGAFEQKQFTIIERFCATIKDVTRREKLLKAIRGRRAFDGFHQAIRRLDLEEQWIGFRNRSFEALAIDWLEKNNIAYDRAA